jgi:hypothetical protein
MSAPDTLTLSALRTATFAPGQLGVLGDPIAHSLSPAMHNAALAVLLPTHPRLAGVRYHRLHITAEELPEALTLLHAQGFAGVNLTVPHKIQALTLVTTLSPEARRAESVNTLVRTPTGWAGHTTDGQGFLEALRERTGGTTKGRPVILLGSGGAARAVAAACLDDGCASLSLHNRDVAKAADLAATLGDPRVRAAGLAEIKSRARRGDRQLHDARPQADGRLAVPGRAPRRRPVRLRYDLRRRTLAPAPGRARTRRRRLRRSFDAPLAGSARLPPLERHAAARRPDARRAR